MTNDAAAAVFGPESLTRGALLPATGRDLMISSCALPPGILDATADGWVSPEIPILVRGQARILPLAWWGAPDRGYNPYAEPSDITRFSRRVLDSCMYAAGPWMSIDLSSDAGDSMGSYAAALRASGVTQADRFVYVQDHLGGVVVRAGDEAAGTRSLAVHVVPEGWVFEPAARGPAAGIDVRWSWADVIDLHRSR